MRPKGKDVRGLAWTNDVAQQMRGDGFRQANTIASEMNALEKGRTRWNARHGLDRGRGGDDFDRRSWRASPAAARDAGAKLILAGDDKQLSSIERGGMFETLRQTHGAATLKDVQRVKDAEQKAAFGKMHEGEFLQALKTFDKAGGIHWTDRQSDTLKDMAARYTADVAATPDKRRFMFAYTNKDVATLERSTPAPCTGSAATLARITAWRRSTARRSSRPATGYSSPATAGRRPRRTQGSPMAASEPSRRSRSTSDGKARVTVALDAAKGDKPQTVSFIVGENSKAGEFNSFKHGYAGTIYRGQGRTLDEAYVAPFGAMAQRRRLCRFDPSPRGRSHIRGARDGQRP